MALPHAPGLQEYAAPAAAATKAAACWSPATRELVAGVVAGAANVTSGYAFDTLKVRQQAVGGNRSMMDLCRSIWRTEGARGFFRGLSSPLIGGAAETGVNYAVYSTALRVLADWHQQQRQHQQQQQQLPPLSAVPIAGGVAGVALSFILSPVELVKCRMQVGQHTSTLACMRHLVASEGLAGLRRGFGATLCRELPGNALFFTAYEGLRRQWPGARGGAHGSGGGSGGGGMWEALCDSGSAILCGGLAGISMWLVVLPLDVAKTRIQTSGPGGPWDTGVARQLVCMWREGGRRALWAGLAPTLVRAFPANACQWLAWEVAMRQLLPAAAEEGSGAGGARAPAAVDPALAAAAAATAAA